MKIIRGQRDSLGVQLEPDYIEEEPYIIAYDWQNNEIYSIDTDEYIYTNGDLVKYEKSDACQYLLDAYDGIILTIEEIKERF